ncbi:DEAD/DEAH box helicase [Gregarina niphandrodes]|uniref:DEAD/DEAH box helicase n=1 Tax=Gregarina niphandrodes TaxID=110365 RepID=A0A023BBV6_GRENI|nr:DEAD/DEAH box helicase [Gregarina niphandrodes]EZG81189.1 DEAD/DEAH box helicase [Gregarina niphandrodes]|eukprot:XP_011134247.1 DEAD/DEAH box helicase [Gregarina niphandrodes]
MIYTAPTSSGKSLVADLVMWTSFYLEFPVDIPRPLCIYLLPFIALVKEKARTLSKIGEELDKKVAPFYFGAPIVNEEDIDVAVCTIEKGSQLVQKYLSCKDRTILTIVIDEFHVFFTQGRGELIENLIIKIKALSERRLGEKRKESLQSSGRRQSSEREEAGPEDVMGEAAALPDGYVTIGATGGLRHYKGEIQIIGMSATFPNRSRLREWLRAVDYEATYRPVELKQYLVLERRTLLCERERQLVPCDPIEVLKPSCGELGSAPVKSAPLKSASLKSASLESAPLEFRQSVLTVPYLALQPYIERNHSALLFCSSRKGCEEWALRLANHCEERSFRPLSPHLTRVVLLLRTSALGTWGTSRAEFWNAVVPYGIGMHHSGMSNSERTIVEEAYRHGVLRVLTATSTLAAGVNLPASRVVFNRPFLGRDFITTMDYRQMCGRAGRTGQGSYGESFLVCQKETDFEKAKTVVLDDLKANRTRSDEAAQRLILQACSLSGEEGLCPNDLHFWLNMSCDEHDLQERQAEHLMNSLIRLGHVIRH